MPDENVVELGLSARATPEELLAYASRLQWEDLLIVGRRTDSRKPELLSSSIVQADALFLLEAARLEVMSDWLRYLAYRQQRKDQTNG